MGENKMATTKKSVKKTTKKTPAVKKPATKRAPAKRVVAKPVSAKKNDSVKYTNMFAAYRAFWRRGFNEWAGTSSRSEYWWSWLVNILVCVLFGLMFVCAAFLDDALFKESAMFTIITGAGLMLYMIAAFIPAISMLTRRMHDAGLSAWFWLLYFATFIPVVGSYLWTLAILIIALLPTSTTDNPYHKYNK